MTPAKSTDPAKSPPAPKEPTPPPAPKESTPPAPDDDDHQADAAAVDRPNPGDLVVVRWQDLANPGREVARYGAVVAVLDQEGTGPAVRVGWFSETSDPLPLDHTVHDRDDAPRVEVLDDDYTPT
jgi:hypothetical protein